MDEIEELEREARSLQTQGKFLEALEAMERLLELRKSFCGAESEPTTQTCLQLCELANMIAVKYLQKDDFQMALDLLKRAEVLSERLDDGKAITYNNFACYYRRLGKTKVALTYLQRAQSIEEKAALSHSPANTHLNMCAVLSQTNKHDQALEHAMSAIIILQGELLELTGDPPNYREKVEFLAMAFHNMAVELEYLRRVTPKQYSEALRYYRKAVEIAQRYLPPGHKTTETLSQVLNTASRQVSTMQQKEDKRRNRTKSQSGVRGYMQSLKKKAFRDTPTRNRGHTQMDVPRAQELDESEARVASIESPVLGRDLATTAGGEMVTTDELRQDEDFYER